MGTTAGNRGKLKLELVIRDQISAIRKREFEKRNSKSETRKAKLVKRPESQDAVIVPRSLHCVPQRTRHCGRDDIQEKDNAGARSTLRFAEEEKMNPRPR